MCAHPRQGGEHGALPAHRAVPGHRGQEGQGGQDHARAAGQDAAARPHAHLLRVQAPAHLPVQPARARRAGGGRRRGGRRARRVQREAQPGGHHGGRGRDAGRGAAARRGHPHHQGRHHAQALPRRVPAHRGELHHARQERLLRQPHLPPRHQGLHDPDGRPARRWHGRREHLGRRVRGRVPQDAAPRPARHPVHGQRGPRHQRLAVLHHHRAHLLAGQQAHRVRARGQGHGRGAGHREVKSGQERQAI
mmetsp:Transcript_11351/g.27791  ORF Transcript_11351/g.27791 Transcript_11351/m.27791 type:complete len:249 (+) Transcript_11351:1261-2007(+)